MINQTDRSVITKHIRNIYQIKEPDIKSTCSKMEQVADNEKTYHYLFYSLVMILAVGYRVKPELLRGTQLRRIPVYNYTPAGNH